MISLAHTCLPQNNKLHLDHFSRVCRLHSYDQHTHTHTHHTNKYNGKNSACDLFNYNIPAISTDSYM